jgi:hypothetical protein
MKIALFVLVLSTVISMAHADDVCGNITGTVHLPAYSFHVGTEAGLALPQVPVSAELDLTQAVWTNGHWGSKLDRVNVAISYDSAQGTYATQAQDVKIPSHWSGLDPDCSEKLQTFEVKFNYPPKDAAGFDPTRAAFDFKYSFPQQGTAYQRPDAASVHAVVLAHLQTITGVMSDATHIVDSSGKTTTLYWQGLSTDESDQDPGLTASEIQMIDNSVANKSVVTIYGDAGDNFIIQNVSN